jgi:hypothetical protein
MKIDETMEMAYPQKIARDIIIGMARPINQHLVKLAGFRFLLNCVDTSNVNWRTCSTRSRGSA